MSRSRYSDDENSSKVSRSNNNKRYVEPIKQDNYQSKRTKTNETKEIWGNIDKEQDEENKFNKPPEEVVEKVKADFGLSGALAKDEATGNLLNGVLLKYTEPLDAAKPTKQWRFYVFKGEEVVETLYIHRKSCYLVGRDNRVVDIVALHESCSKQHAVIQFRRVDDDIVKPYIIDLGSANKTFLNGNAVEDSRYYELMEKDIVKFGCSSREYVLLHGNSAKG